MSAFDKPCRLTQLGSRPQRVPYGIDRQTHRARQPNPHTLNRPSPTPSLRPNPSPTPEIDHPTSLDGVSRQTGKQWTWAKPKSSLDGVSRQTGKQWTWAKPNSILAGESALTAGATRASRTT
ncbi:MAG: hypothetical protein ACI841_000982 [Planctomycetota bacterium]|jgi:hypothetical protein